MYVRSIILFFKLTISIGEGKLGTDENAFVDIFGFASQRRRQTSVIFQMYKKISGKTIEQALKSEMSGDLLHGLLDIGMPLSLIYDCKYLNIISFDQITIPNISVKIVYNRPAFFAGRLELAMKGLGTNDDALIRIIVDRCEIDLVNVKSEYERIYSKTLLSSVKVNG
jgi:annexin A7/11